MAAAATVSGVFNENPNAQTNVKGQTDGMEKGGGTRKPEININDPRRQRVINANNKNLTAAAFTYLSGEAHTGSGDIITGMNIGNPAAAAAARQRLCRSDRVRSDFSAR